MDYTSKKCYSDMREGKVVFAMETKIFVVGHKNPDTDSICSAIAYAYLKEKITGMHYEARRIGEINGETAYVLDKFKVEAPEFLESVQLQVKDLDIRKIEGISGQMSMQEAWKRMKNENMKTLPVTRGNKLEGMITIGDIAESYMEVYDNHILSMSKTQYRNIADTMDGVFVTGNEHSYFVNGKVMVAASEVSHMEENIEKDDMVIVGNRLDMQRAAIEKNVSCLVVCQDEEVDETIKQLALEKEITIIHTKHGVFNASRNIHQSIPVRYLMTKKEKLISFRPEEYVEDIKEEMSKTKYRDFPVIDNQGNFVGFISRRRLMSVRKKQVVLVDHNEKTQTVDGIEEAEILEIIDHHRLGNLETAGPVYFRNQPVGCTATIIYQMYLENKVKITKEIAGLLCSAILSDTLLFRSPTCTAVDEMAAHSLAQIAGIDVEDHAKKMFQAGSNLRGKTPEEICFQDFKVFHAGEEIFGIGQISFLDGQEIEGVKEELKSYLEEARKDQGLHQIYIMLTNILEESSEILYSGTHAKEHICHAFEITEPGEKIILKGVVSRKKQMIPALVGYLQEK